MIGTTLKFLIEEPSPLPILIHIGPKYSPQDPVFKNTLSLHSSLNVRGHVSQPYNTTGNIVVLYIHIYTYIYIYIYIYMQTLISSIRY